MASDTTRGQGGPSRRAFGGGLLALGGAVVIGTVPGAAAASEPGPGAGLPGGPTGGSGYGSGPWSDGGPCPGA